ncbi:TetR/AcrR family transcriptional regulator [Paractinoplanes durhamensis]|uniref:TetR family transcriptional regulator n=1 Tax=Paractinoplanes durhamensis TaxID=113563 RepID=A0ABQ3YR22_9ACTN|nr:TetR/AcrR family transcriptional regulator [Actinoplanes durhamensis]GIE00027.1 TetR family transcriptional regulator [Actinoplanes durhamensis]
MLYGAQPARRRDAQRNRTAILQAACELMETDQNSVLMPEIARRAGIGQATLYRHFPDRTALATAVIGYLIDQLERCVAAGLESPATFRTALNEILRAQVTMRPLVQLARRLDAATRGRFLRRLVGVLAEPLRRAQDFGHVRADLVPDDLVLLFGMVEGVVEGARSHAEAVAAAGRSIDLALDGVFRPISSPSEAPLRIGKL